MSKARVYLKIILFAVAIFIFGKVYASYPWNVIYPYGIQTTDANATANALAAYNTWVSNCITSNGAGGYQRVQRPEDSNDTVSEGIGYGMIMAIYFSNQALLNNLWQYKQSHNDGNLLMDWHINSANAMASDGAGSATDADEDIAFSLVMADREWGSGGTYNYLSLASAEITKLKTYDCVSYDYHLKPGDGWDTEEFPSYYMPAWYREYAVVNPSDATFWNNVLAKCDSNLAVGMSTHGLVAEELTHTGTAYGLGTQYSYPEYSYNSCRVPWRYAIDFVWNGGQSPNMQTEYNEMAAFWSGKTPGSVVDGYNVATGAATGQWNNAAFVGPDGCSLMESSAYQTNLDNYFTADYNLGYGNYYSGALGVMTMLLMSGNFPKNFYTPTNTPIVSPTPTYTITETSTVTPIVSPTPSYTVTPTHTITPVPTFTPTYNPSKGIMIYPNPVNYNTTQWMTIKFYLPRFESVVWVKIYTFSLRLIAQFYLTDYNLPQGWHKEQIYVQQYLYNAANGIYYYAIYDNKNGNLEQISQTDAFILLR